MPGKRMTIEDLARIVKKGFDETATKEQYEKIDKRLINVENRLENIEKLILV